MSCSYVYIYKLPSLYLSTNVVCVQVGYDSQQLFYFLLLTQLTVLVITDSCWSWVNSKLSVYQVVEMLHSNLHTYVSVIIMMKTKSETLVRFCIYLFIVDHTQLSSVMTKHKPDFRSTVNCNWGLVTELIRFWNWPIQDQRSNILNIFLPV